MFIGRVVGSVWSTVKWPAVEGIKLLAVRPYHLADLAPAELARSAGESGRGGCDDLVICADVLDAGVGDDVIIAYGHAARVALHEVLGPDDRPAVPIDAAVVAVVDRLEVAPLPAHQGGQDPAAGASTD